MKTTFAILTLAALAIVPMHVANASDSCNSQIVIFSDNSALGVSLNSNAGSCAVKSSLGVGSDPDTAFINPASDEVQIRFLNNVGIPMLTCHVEGLGVDGDFDAVLHDGTGLGDLVYDTASIAIDSTASGSISATCYDPADLVNELDSVTFHTVA